MRDELKDGALQGVVALQGIGVLMLFDASEKRHGPRVELAPVLSSIKLSVRISTSPSSLALSEMSDAPTREVT